MSASASRRIFNNLRLVLFERIFKRFSETDGLARYDVHERPALHSREYRRIHRLGERLVVRHDEPPARAAQSLVGGGGDEVAVRNGRRVETRGDEPRYVGDVGHEQRAALLGDFAHSLEVDFARIRGSPDRYELGLFGEGGLFELVVVDEAGFDVHSVIYDAEKHSGKVLGVAVREMPSVFEAHRQNFIAGFEDGCVYGGVGLRARMGLDIGELHAEKLFGALYREPLHNVHKLAAAVIPLARIPLGVLVGERGAHRLHDRRNHEIFRRYEFDMSLLTFGFVAYGVEYRPVDFL